MFWKVLLLLALHPLGKWIRSSSHKASGQDLLSLVVQGGRQSGGILQGISSAGGLGSGAGNKGASACAGRETASPSVRGLIFFFFFNSPPPPPPTKRSSLFFLLCWRGGECGKKKTLCCLNTFCLFVFPLKYFLCILRKRIDDLSRSIFFTCFQFAKTVFHKKMLMCVVACRFMHVRDSSASCVYEYKGLRGSFPPL